MKTSIEEKIIDFLGNLNSYKNADKQKQLELCQVGKTLATYFPDFEIKELREAPDFIVTNDDSEIAIEHEIIRNFEVIKHQGYYENIFHLAERNLQNDKNSPKFLANCYLKPNLNFKNKDKNQLIEIVTCVVKEYVSTGKLLPNPIIEEVFTMPHSKTTLDANFGTYTTNYLTTDIV